MKFEDDVPRTMMTLERLKLCPSAALTEVLYFALLMQPLWAWFLIADPMCRVAAARWCVGKVSNPGIEAEEVNTISRFTLCLRTWNI